MYDVLKYRPAQMKHFRDECKLSVQVDFEEKCTWNFKI